MQAGTEADWEHFFPAVSGSSAHAHALHQGPAWMLPAGLPLPLAGLPHLSSDAHPAAHPASAAYANCGSSGFELGVAQQAGGAASMPQLSLTQQLMGAQPSAPQRVLRPRRGQLPAAPLDLSALQVNFFSAWQQCPDRAYTGTVQLIATIDRSQARPR